MEDPGDKFILKELGCLNTIWGQQFSRESRTQQVRVTNRLHRLKSDGDSHRKTPTEY